MAAVPWVWKSRNEPAVRFCLAWIVPTWLVFELITTKLPHYVLQVYPAIAILLALALLHGRRPNLIVAWLAVLAVVIYGGSLFAVLYVLEGEIAPTVLIVTATAAAVMGVSMLNANVASPVSLAAGITLSALLMNGLLAAFAPSLKTVWVAPRLAAAVGHDAQCPRPDVASAGYQEASLVFLLGTGTRLVDGEGAARFLADGGCRIALVTEPEEAAFRATLAALSTQAELLDHVAGMNVGRVGKADIGVYRLRAP
jgi:4-amino-4-deoxy-L-arabinose transferase-like glycosyltransferase